MLNDQQLIEELRARLRQQAAGLEPADHLLTDLERRHVRRVRQARFLAAAASAIVVVAVTTVAVIAGAKVASQAPAEPAPSTTFTSTPTATPTSAPQNAEPLLQRARKALVGTENMVVHVHCQTRTVAGVMKLDLEGWVLESAGRSRVLFYYAMATPQADTVNIRRPDGYTITESLDLTNRTIATMEGPYGQTFSWCA